MSEELRSASGLPADDFNALASVLYEPMRKFAHSFVSAMSDIRPEDADDFVERAFEQAWNSRRAPYEQEDLRRWLRTVIQNMVKDRWRAVSRSRSLSLMADRSVDEDESGLPVVPSPEDAVLDRIVVNELLAELPADERAALVLLAAGASRREIAWELGMSQSHLMRVISRARYRVHRDLNYEMEEHDVGTAIAHLKFAATPRADPHTLAVVADALEQLPAEDRRWLELWYLDAGGAYGDFPSVAAKMGVTVEEGRTRLRRARLRFQRAWDKRSS